MGSPEVIAKQDMEGRIRQPEDPERMWPTDNNEPRSFVPRVEVIWPVCLRNKCS